MPPVRSASTRRPFKDADLDSVVELLETLPRIHVTDGGPYTFAARAQDFMAVFNGHSTPEQGQRVLAQVAQICDPVSKIADADKPGTLAFKAGMRRVMAEIMLCMVTREPVRVERKSTNEHTESSA